MSGKMKACFFDRDGVINEERNYLYDPAEVVICPGVADAIRLMRQHGYKIIVVSNQSGIARGYFTFDDIHAVERRICELLGGNGAEIDAWYYCPHYATGKVAPYNRECDCRKPKPGLLLQAAKEYELDLEKSFIIGDKTSDLAVGYAAGCHDTALVRTGHGMEQSLAEYPDAIDAPDVLTAARELLKRAGEEIR